MAHRAADEQFHRIFEVHPAGGQRADDAVFESEHRLAGLVAITIPMRHRTNVARDGLDVAEQPHQNVQLVRAEVAERADPGNFRIGHPAPFRVEPAGQGTVVTVRGADARDLAEIPGGHFDTEWRWM